MNKPSFPLPASLSAAIDVLNLASKLVHYALKPSQEADCWDKISKIAAEQAAKPSIDGVSLHE